MILGIFVHAEIKRYEFHTLVDIFQENILILFVYTSIDKWHNFILPLY